MALRASHNSHVARPRLLRPGFEDKPIMVAVFYEIAMVAALYETAMAAVLYTIHAVWQQDIAQKAVSERWTKM